MPSAVSEENPLGCPLVGAIRAFGGKWKPAILRELIAEPRRFGALKRSLPGISTRVLTLQLRELEADGLVTRSVEPSKPPKVTYALSSRGAALGPILAALHAWGASAAGGFRPSTPGGSA